MPAATLTSKGQVTIPATVREDLGLNTGDRIDFVRNEITGGYEIYPARLAIQLLKGAVSAPSHPISIEEMNEVISRQGEDQP